MRAERRGVFRQADDVPERSRHRQGVEAAAAAVGTAEGHRQELIDDQADAQRQQGGGVEFEGTTVDEEHQQAVRRIFRPPAHRVGRQRAGRAERAHTSPDERVRHLPRDVDRQLSTHLEPHREAVDDLAGRDQQLRTAAGHRQAGEGCKQNRREGRERLAQLQRDECWRRARPHLVSAQRYG